MKTFTAVSQKIKSDLGIKTDWLNGLFYDTDCHRINKRYFKLLFLWSWLSRTGQATCRKGNKKCIFLSFIWNLGSMKAFILCPHAPLLYMTKHLKNLPRISTNSMSVDWECKRKPSMWWRFSGSWWLYSEWIKVRKKAKFWWGGKLSGYIFKKEAHLQVVWRPESSFLIMPFLLVSHDNKQCIFWFPWQLTL